MCQYCEDEITIFTKQSISQCSFGWGDSKIDLSEAILLVECLVIDARGFLRLIDRENSECIDDEQTIPINFCPFCGKKF